MTKYYVEVEYPNGRKNAIKLRVGKGLTLERLREMVEGGRTVYPDQWCLTGGRGHVTSFSTWKTPRVPQQLIDLFNQSTTQDYSGQPIECQFHLKTTEGDSKVMIM